MQTEWTRGFVGLMAVLLSALPAAAAEPVPGAFTGTLISPDTGLPVTGVKLALVDPNEYTTTTGVGGRFAFQNVPAGTYQYLFAFEQGEAQPRGSMLLAKNTTVAPHTAGQVTIERKLLAERPEQEPPRVLHLRFSDNRDRAYSRPVVLKDSLGLDWPEEYVTLAMGFERGRCRRPSLRVVDGSTGQEMPFQASDVKYSAGDFVTSCVLTFPASLAPFQQKVYAVCGDWREGFTPPTLETDLKVEVRETSGERVVSNSLISLILPPPASDKAMPAETCPPPIIALRGPDGVWFGSGRLISKRTVQSYTCEEVEKGPIYREFRVTYKFAEEKGAKPDEPKAAPTYEVSVRVYSARDFILLRERMTGEAEASFRFSWHANLSPDSALLVRNGAAVFESLNPAYVQPTTTLAVFRAWNPPGLRNSHNWYGAYSSGNRKDAVGLVQVEGAGWAFADRNLWADGSWLGKADDEREVRLVATSAPDLYLDFPFRQGTRAFALAVFDKTRNWDPASLAAATSSSRRIHYLNRLHMLFSQMDLSRLMMLRPERAKMTERPRLLFNAQLYSRLKTLYDKDPNQVPEILRDVLSGSRAHTSLVRTHVMAAVLALRRAFLGTTSEDTISGFCSQLADPAVLDPIVKYLVLVYDAHSRSGLFSEREKEVILSTLAVAAAQLEHSNYWPAFAHAPDVVARRDSALTFLSLLLDDAPQSTARIAAARTNFLRYLAQVNAAGGVPNDVGPFTTALNVWTETAPALERGTLAGSLFAAPEFIMTLDRLTLLTTPPDRRYGGLRLPPSIGRCPSGSPEELGALGLAAAECARWLPPLAARLAWGWDQAGRPVFGVLSRHQALLNVLKVMPTETDAKAPETMGSTVLPGFGALLRARFGEPDEAYLLLKASALPFSFHHDQLSLLFHAFGSPLLVDSGSPPERQAGWAHNTVRIDSRVHKAPASVAEFIGLEEDDYVLADLTVEALSKLKEYTRPELDALAAAAKDGTFVLPPGHNADGSQTAEMLAATEKLEHPVRVRREIFFNKQRQYAVVVDRVQGELPTDVFFNVFADQAQTEGNAVRFAGPFGVDLDIHAFGTAKPQVSVHRDLPQRWCVRISQPVPPKPPEPLEPPTDTEPGPPRPAVPAGSAPPAAGAEPPSVEYISVLCPSRRNLAGLAETRPYAPPQVERLEGVPAVRIAYADTVRFIFLGDREIKYEAADVLFTGRRGMLTVRPDHVAILLLDAGELRHKGMGVRTDRGVVRFTMAPGGFVTGQVMGPKEKTLTFYGLGSPPSRLSFQAGGLEFLGKGDRASATYGVGPGTQSITIEPR